MLNPFVEHANFFGSDTVICRYLASIIIFLPYIILLVMVVNGSVFVFIHGAMYDRTFRYVCPQILFIGASPMLRMLIATVSLWAHPSEHEINIW